MNARKFYSVFCCLQLIVALVLFISCSKDNPSPSPDEKPATNAPPTNLKFFLATSDQSFPVEIVPYVPEDADIGYKVSQIVTVDEDEGDMHSYTLVPGASDNTAFEIDGDILVTKQRFDHETKALYKVKLRTTDRAGVSFEKEVDISVSNVNEAPLKISLSTEEVLENKKGGAALADISTTDPDVGNTHTYTLADGEGAKDNVFFTVDRDVLKSKPDLVFDDTKKNSYSIRIKSEDQDGLTVERSFTLKVLDAGTPPTGVFLSADSILEGSPVGTVIGRLQTKDTDLGDTHTYELLSGKEDNANFKIDTTGTLHSKAVFVYQKRGVYSIYVRTTDSKGNSFESAISVRVLSKGASPTGVTLSPNAIAERKPAGTQVGTLYTADEDVRDKHTYTLLSYLEEFEIVGDKLLVKKPLSFVSKSRYDLKIRTTDTKGNTYTKSVNVLIDDVPDSPLSISLTPNEIEEGKPANTIVGTFSTIDYDKGDTHIYTLVSGHGATDNSKFSIERQTSNGAFVLKTKQQFKISVQPSLSIRVRTEAQNKQGETPFETSITIKVIPPNKPPTDIILSASSIAEGKSIGTTIGRFTAQDGDAQDTHTYTLVSGAGSGDNANFTIDGALLKSKMMFDYAVKNTHQVRIRVQDGRGGAYEKNFTITIIQKIPNQAPTDISLDRSTLILPAYNDEILATVTATDANFGETFTYELINPDSSSTIPYTLYNAFKIDKDKLVIKDILLIHEGLIKIKIKATDSQGATFEKIFDIQVKNSRPFSMLWKTENNGESVTIATNPNPLKVAYRYDVDWGYEDQKTRYVTGNISHKYLPSGSYKVSVYRDFSSIYFNGPSDNASKLIEILSWGETAWETMNSAFYGCKNLKKLPTSSAPDLSQVTDMRRMFSGATSLDADISHWDVSQVTDMSEMFKGVTLSTANYDKLLIEWAKLSLQKGVNFDAGMSKYSVKSEAARQVLTSTYGWKITDGGKE